VTKTNSLPEKPIAEEVYENWIDVDSHLDIAEVPTEE